MLLAHKALVLRHDGAHLVGSLIQLCFCLERRFAAQILRLLCRQLERMVSILLRIRHRILGGLLRDHKRLAHALLNAPKVLNFLPLPRKLRAQVLILVHRRGIRLHDLV